MGLSDTISDLKYAFYKDPAASMPPQVRVTHPNVTDKLVEVWDGTAWHVVSYDSEWRDITATATLAETAVLTGLYIRRTDSIVTLQIILSDSQANPSRLILAPNPVGFRPNNRANYFSIPADDSNIFPGVELRLNVRANISYGGPTFSGTFDGTVMWSTTNGIPTSLPGIPGGMLRPGAPELGD
jgi:hypothetical protein